MKKYVLFILCIILFTSCDKLLVEKPKSFLSPAQFFNSDDEAIAAVNGAYSTLYYIYNNGNGTGGLGYWSPLGTDIARPTGGRESTFPFHTYSLSSSNEANSDNVWTTLYKGVANCNLVIDGVTNNSSISSKVSSEVLGQAMFLRSLYYYWLTCMWGDVPMWLDALDVDKIGGEIPRTPVDSVRLQMISDLKVAAADLPSAWSGADLGRPSKWAVDMLLCKYYLWEKDWSNAKTIAGEIITQQNGNHHLLANYADIWGYR